MAWGDLLARLGGRVPEEEPAASPLPAPPTSVTLYEALERTEQLVADASVPSPVTARVRRVTATVRDTVPRLDSLGAGSDRAYAVMATATDYLPEAVSGYLRLPRRFADTRPIDGHKSALMVLVDQLDLLGATMDAVYDAVCRDDAIALVAHGRFLAEKFGTPGGALRLDSPDTSGSPGGPGGPGGPGVLGGMGVPGALPAPGAAGPAAEPVPPPEPAAPRAPAADTAVEAPNPSGDVLDPPDRLAPPAPGAQAVPSEAPAPGADESAPEVTRAPGSAEGGEAATATSASAPASADPLVAPASPLSPTPPAVRHQTPPPDPLRPPSSLDL